MTASTTRNSIPIIPLTSDNLGAFIKTADARTQQWVAQNNFTASPGSALIMPNADGGIACILAGINEAPHIWSLAHIPAIAPEGNYHLQADWDAQILQNVALGMQLAQYRFDRYKTQKPASMKLQLPDSTDQAEITRLETAINFTRDLINTPTNDMQPHHLAQEAKALADSLNVSFTEIVGDDLLTENYPAIHAVGRASDSPPRLLEWRYGDASHPKVTLVGKGVCFDTGGLDLKPYSSMKLMKKDMGGAALIMGLSKAVIEAKLKINLRVLIPAVENSVSANAFRPQDILNTRKGLSVEIGSTDAEGRLVLCDALAAAQEESPDLIIDAATLTGAARAALGTDLPALFSNKDDVAQEMQTLSHACHDPLWHMPLWQGYDAYVESPIADITNSANYRFAGAITAALFLQRFVSPQTNWVHIDSYAWNDSARPGRPAGAEALALRAIYLYLKARYGTV
jgi:leucyl aminopeptidase